MKKTVSAFWKEPNHDVLLQLSLETKILYIKQISQSTTVEGLKSILSQFGEITKIRKFATKAYVEFKEVESAKKAYEMMQEKRVDGIVWQIYPAKKLDELRSKESQDQNLLFSKNFLDDADQEIIMKFPFEGNLPEIPQQALINANRILENTKMMQQNQLKMLEMQIQSFQNLQNNMNNPASNGNAQNQPAQQPNNNPNANNNGNQMNPNKKQGMNKNKQQKKGNFNQKQNPNQNQNNMN